MPVFTANGISYVKKSRSRFLDALVSTKEKDNKTGAKPSGEIRRKKQSAGRTQLSGPPGLAGQRVASPVPRSRSFSTSSPPYRPITPSARSNSRPPSSVVTIPQKAKAQAQQQMHQTHSHSSSPQPPGQTSQRHRSPRNGQVSRHGKTTSRRKKVAGPRAIDPSWFFPVGSKVKHQQLGEGVVLPSAPSKEDGDHNVLVKFGNGEKRAFCLHGSDISPIV